MMIFRKAELAQLGFKPKPRKVCNTFAISYWDTGACCCQCRQRARNRGRPAPKRFPLSNRASEGKRKLSFEAYFRVWFHGSALNCSQISSSLLRQRGSRKNRQLPGIRPRPRSLAESPSPSRAVFRYRWGDAAHVAGNGAQIHPHAGGHVHHRSACPLFPKHAQYQPQSGRVGGIWSRSPLLKCEPGSAVAVQMSSDVIRCHVARGAWCCRSRKDVEK